MKNISDVKKRIIQIIEKEGISKRKFYTRSGISNGSLDKEGGVTMALVEKFSNVYPDIDLTWLLTGQGEKFKTRYPSAHEPEAIYTSPKRYKTPSGNQGINTPDSVLPKLTPYYDLKSINDDPINHHEHLRNPDGFIQVPGLGECDFAIPVFGNSMSPEINHGDLVGVKEIKEKNFFNYGAKYFILTSEQRLIRYIHPHPDHEDQLILKSSNASHEDITIRRDLITAFYLITFILKREV